MNKEMPNPMGTDEIFAEADKTTDAAVKAAFGGDEKEEKQTEKAEAEPKVQEAPAFDIGEVLASIPGAPKKDLIEKWKKDFGDVYVLPLDAKEIYVWRPLRHLEYQNLVSSDAGKQDASFREAVVIRALLWPKLMPEQVANTRAGLMDTLFQVIMQGSYFLTPEFALSLVQKL